MTSIAQNGISSRDRQTTRPLWWLFQPTFLLVITGFPGAFVNAFSIDSPLPCTNRMLFLAPHISTGPQYRSLDRPAADEMV